VLMDASYGSNRALRAGVSTLGLSYVAAIVPTVKPIFYSLSRLTWGKPLILLVRG